MEHEHEGYTYQIDKLGLKDAKECLAHLTEMEFFDKGLEALISSPEKLDKLERMLFRTKVQLLNENGDLIPLGKELTEKHFEGRLPAYFNVLVQSITHNFSDFLLGGWTTGLEADESPEQ